MRAEICSVSALTLCVVLGVLYQHTDNIFAHIALGVGCVLSSVSTIVLLLSIINAAQRHAACESLLRQQQHYDIYTVQPKHDIESDSDSESELDPNPDNTCCYCLQHIIINMLSDNYESIQLVKVTDNMLTLPNLNVCFANTEIGTIVNFFKQEYDLSYNEICTVKHGDIMLSVVLDDVNYLLLFDCGIESRLGWLATSHKYSDLDSDSE